MKLIFQLFFLVTALNFSLADIAMADSDPADQVPAALAPNPTYPAVLHINPNTLRTYLLSSNRGVLESLNSVLAAKQNVSSKRGALLPSLNISAFISRFPNFASATVQVLLPFLVPSNWFNLDMSKQQLAATGYAYYLLELNNYASAVGLYETVVGDIELSKVLAQQYKILKQISDYVFNEYQIGIETAADVAQGKYQAQAALGQLQKINELIAQEQSQVRALLGLPLSVKLIFDDTHMSSIGQEQVAASTILATVNPVSAEERQFESLIAASNDNKKNAQFSFLTGAAVNYNSIGSSAFASNAEVTGGIGFSYIPNINIASLNTSQLRLQQSELRIQQGQTIESALASIKEDREQMASANEAVRQAQIFFNGEMAAYKLATVDLLHALQASTNLITAETTAVNVKIDLDNQRLTLLRILVAGEFAKIPTCATKGAEKSGGIFGVLGSFLGGKKKTISVDQLCGATAAAAQQASSGIVPN
jgi:outer membrane protein TolC